METPTLRTSRLILRPIALSDAPAIQRYFNNWNIIQYLATVVPWPYPDDGAETFIRLQLEKIAAGEAIHSWVLALRSGDGEAIGNIHFRPWSDSPKGNRGFWLAEPWWNQGLMTEAVAAVNNFAFHTLGVESSMSATRPQTKRRAGSSKRPAPNLLAISNFSITMARRGRKNGALPVKTGCAKILPMAVEGRTAEIKGDRNAHHDS